MARRAVTGLAAGALTLALVAAAWPVRAHAAAPVGDAARTLTVSVPGPFNGCSVLDPGATATTGAVLDLLRPSAFTTTPTGGLAGAGGPIAAAELTSLSPETVVYTIASHELWSNGLTFNGADLVAWWQRARSLASVTSDGYRAIQSLTVGSNGLTVTAIFATPYADWNLLFRDVEARGVTPGCAIANLTRRPSLGPYRVVSATTRQVVLAKSPRWTTNPLRFGTIVLVTTEVIPARTSTPFANYSLGVTRPQIQALSAHPSVASRIGTSSDVEVITFAPARPFTRTLAMREALSWALDRQVLINKLWGSITFSPAVAASAVYSQGQSAYPGGSGTTPTSPSTSAPTTIPTANGQADCLTCADAQLVAQGFRRSGHRWVRGEQTLAVRIISGPSALDRATVAAVARQWVSVGIPAAVVHDTSDASAAAAVATNLADVAIYAKPTTTTPSVAARSWSGPAFADSYLGGFRSASVSTLFTDAISNFNPVAATTTWLQLDQAVLRSFWIRPLYTAPSLEEWSNVLVGVTGSLSESGFLDQLPNWNTATATKS
ncbi:MAG: ABC transporter substrate-binding protein [Acidimicrobiales bacterium]